MRTTLNIDNQLMREAQASTGIKVKTRIVRAALQALIEREAKNSVGADLSANAALKINDLRDDRRQGGCRKTQRGAAVGADLSANDPASH